MSDLFNIGTKNDICDHKIGLACVNKATTHLEFPTALNPLADALKRGNILEQRVRLRMIEGELDDEFLSRSKLTLHIVAFEVLCVFLIKINTIETYTRHQLVCPGLLELVVE